MFRTVLILSALAAIALLSVQTLAFAAERHSWSPAESEAVPERAEHLAKNFDVPPLFERNQQVGPVAARLDEVELKTSTLPLTLLSTWVPTRPGQEALATLAHNRERALVSPGDEVLKVAVLESVAPDHVVVRNLQTQALERVPLERDRGVTPKKVKRKRKDARPAKTARFVAHVEALGKDHYSVDRQKLFSVIGDAQHALMGDARVTPQIRNGSVAGFKLARITRGSVYEALGLRAGDLIQGANGRPLASIDDALTLIGELTTAERVELQVKRGRTSRTLKYELR